jgi:hypothetical protein
VDAIAEYAEDRPLAWIDDNVDESCRAWAARRAAPTLIVETLRHEGMGEEHVEMLLEWAERLRQGRDGTRESPRAVPD